MKLVKRDKLSLVAGLSAAAPLFVARAAAAALRAPSGFTIVCHDYNKGIAYN